MMLLVVMSVMSLTSCFVCFLFFQSQLDKLNLLSFPFISYVSFNPNAPQHYTRFGRWRLDDRALLGVDDDLALRRNRPRACHGLYSVEFRDGGGEM